MKRRIKAICFMILLALLAVFPSSAASRGKIPSERLMPRLVDDADLLTEEEENTLLTKLDEISERQAFDVAVVTVDSLEGKTSMDYADDFYDYNGYGYGENRDGILLLISMEERDWWISTCGFGITAFTDAGQGYMAEQFKSSLSSGSYEKAFTTFAKLCDDFITQAKTGEPYDTGKLPKGTVSNIWIIGDLVIGLFVAWMMANRKKEKLVSVRKQFSAETYMVPGGVTLTNQRDQFLNRMTIQREIHQEPSHTESSTSGSSTHVSSSGTTHGGSGGKF